MGDSVKHDWCQQLIRDLVHTNKFEGRARAIALQMLAGSVPTGSRLQAHGWQSEIVCECGARDTIGHRL